MGSARFPRLEAVFGGPLDGLTGDDFRRVVAAASSSAPVREDADLDFKESLYASDDRGKHHLAEDVASLANARGGAIIIGIRADKATAVATELTAVELTDAERLRMQSIIASNVFPLPATDIILVPTAEGAGLYIVVVHPSPLAPHAVRQSNMGLRYYRREGSANRILAESEIADMYRRRFMDARSRADRLTTISKDGAAALRPLEDRCWLTLSLVPVAPGTAEISGASLRALQSEWLPRFCGGFFGDAPFGRGAPFELEPGVGRVELTSYRGGGGPPTYAYAAFYSDGAAFVALPLHSCVLGQQPKQQLFGIDDEQVVLSMSGQLVAACSHAALNCGCSGDALAVSGVGYEPLGDPLVIGYSRRYGTWESWRRTRSVKGEFPSLPAHSINVVAVLESTAERLSATRIVLTDLFHAFALPEVAQITASGAFRAKYWNHGVLDKWTSAKDVPRVDDELERS